MRDRFLLLTLAVFCLAVQPEARAQKRIAPYSQTAETLCRCSPGISPSTGGIRTFEQFMAKRRESFKSPAEARLAWRVYQAANRCDAVVIVGRLSDTGSFENKPGYCVLRSLGGWTMAVNEAFIHGGTDRGARFALTSEMPPETMDSDVDLSQVENDRDTHWRIIYNREIKWVLDTGRYQLAYDKTRKITPTNLASLNVTDHRATVGRANKSGVARRWVLESATVSPETPPQGWTYSAQSSSAHYTIYNGDKADFQWTPPPQQIDENGFTVSLSVQARPIPNNRLAAIISVSGAGLNTDTPSDNQSAYAKAESGAAASAQTSVTFKPTPNSTGLEVKIGMMWAITFTYKYRLAQ